MTDGRITSCLKKDGCRGPKKVYFHVEAYPSHTSSRSGAASIVKYYGMRTEEMLTYQHSVKCELDYVDPFLAALHAMRMSWDVSSSQLGLGGYDGFPTYILNKPDDDDDGHPGGVEWHEQFQHLEPHNPTVVFEGAHIPEQRTCLAIATVTEPQHHFSVTSFGFDGHFLGRRSLQVTGENWQARVKQQWADHCIVEETSLHPVQPQPENQPNVLWVIAQCSAIDNNHRVVLSQVDDNPNYRVCAIPASSLRFHVLNACNVQPGLHDDAVVKRGPLPFLLGIPCSISDGDFIRILTSAGEYHQHRLLPDPGRPSLPQHSEDEQEIFDDMQAP